MPSCPPCLAPTRRRALLLVSSIFIFFCAAYAFTASGDVFSNGDTAIRIEQAQAILDGRLDLAGVKLQYPHHMKKEFYDSRLWFCRRDLVCTTYLLGQPLALVPLNEAATAVTLHERWPFGPGIALLDRLIGPIFGALEVSLFFVFAVRLGYGRRRALLLTLILAFATSVWPDSQSAQEHGEVAFFLLLGMYFAFRFRDQERGRQYLVYAGLALGGAMITRYQDAVIGLIAVGLYLIWPGGRASGFGSRIRWILLVAVGVLPSILVDAWWDWWRFGSPLATGHHEAVFGYAPWLGASGLLISPGKGLLWYCPTVFLLAIAGVPFARRFPALAAAIGALFLGFVGLYANVTFWHGDPAWGPRYIFPVVPFLTLPLGTLLMSRARLAPLLSAVVAFVILTGFVVQVAGVSVSEWRGWYKVISYEENQGRTWVWIPSRYRYFWDWHESPLYFQLHGVYDLAYDSFAHSDKYDLVPPPQDRILDDLGATYAINDWNFWWAANANNWWLGEQKIILGVVFLLAVMGASGAYIAAETWDVFTQPAQRGRDRSLPEAA